ncbi:g3250 [Coccomyxa viridis]|uniref:G3250 protein n=1 Tax=Coccomyxa viridis TaxID=1274662 RepID=A0ABP1FMD7_9CHLO
MNAQSLLRRLALLYCLLHLSKCSVLDSIVPGSCPITPSKEKGIIDITVGLGPRTLLMDSEEGMGDFRYLSNSIDEGDIFNGSMLKDFTAHAGTHVDAPGHFVNEAYHAKKGVHQLDLNILNGAALVMEVPDDTNITAAALEAMHIPPGTIRVLFKTLNTKKKLMTQTAFDPSYTAVTKDGAEWIVKRGDIRLVGIDYISVAHYADLIGPHIALLTDEIIPVEGLVLEDVEPGLYDLHCLPMKLVNSDGAPARCILR